VAAADYQINRVAQYRNVPAAQVAALVKKYNTGRQFGIFGEPYVNVLELNLALDNMK
jgi:K+-transporting ATPase ATPase C chain